MKSTELLDRLALIADLEASGGEGVEGPISALQIWIGTVGFVDGDDELVAIGHRNKVAGKDEGTEFWLLSKTLNASSQLTVHELEQGQTYSEAAFKAKALAYFDCFYEDCGKARPELQLHAHEWVKRAGGPPADPNPSCSAPSGWTQIWDQYCP